MSAAESSHPSPELSQDDLEFKQICEQGEQNALKAIELLEVYEKELEEQGLLEDD